MVAARLSETARDDDTISRSRRLLGASLTGALAGMLLVVLRYWGVGPPIAWLWFLLMGASGMLALLSILPTDRVAIRVVLCEFGFLFLAGGGGYIASQAIRFWNLFGPRNPSAAAYGLMASAIVTLIALWIPMLMPRRDAPSLCSALDIGQKNLSNAGFYRAPSCRSPLTFILFYICWLPTRLLIATRLEASGVWYRMSAEASLRRVWIVVRLGVFALCTFCWGLCILEWIRWTFIERPRDVQIGLCLIGTLALLLAFLSPGVRQSVQHCLIPPDVATMVMEKDILPVTL
jgi:hypothetical protein